VDQQRTKPFLLDKKHSKTPAHPLQIIPPYKLLSKLRTCMIFFVCFIQASFAGRGFCNQSTSSALTRCSNELCSHLEVASSPQQMRSRGEHQCRQHCTLQRFACPTSNLASGYRATRAALRVQREEEEDDSKEEGKEWQQGNNQKNPWESPLPP